MNVIQAIKQRQSVRAYQSKEVDSDLIKTIFAQAQQAPSNCNSQPWHTVVVSGQARNQLEDALVKEVMAQKPPTPHFKPGDQDLKEQYRKRQIDCAISLYDSVGVKYEEKEKRQELMLQNWRFFGAPHVAFFSMPKSMSEINAVDMGIYLQTIMLLMTENDIACCPQGALAVFPEPIYRIANIPNNNAIMFGLSFGYAEKEAPINQYDVGRGNIEDCVEFID